MSNATGIVTLADFLRARYDEVICDKCGSDLTAPSGARGVAEIKAKRFLLSRLPELEFLAARNGDDSPAMSILNEYLLVILPAFALAFADHPDYRREWTP